MTHHEDRRFTKYMLTNAEVMNEEEAEQKVEAFKQTARMARRLYGDWRNDGYLDSTYEVEDRVNAVLSFGGDDQPSQRSRLMRAAMRGVGPDVREYIISRATRHDGDSALTIEIRGETGTGKSGLALAIAEMLGLTPEQVADAVHFHARPFVNALREQVDARRRGEPHTPVVIMDESNLPVGEGSKVIQDVLRNEEGRVRQGGVSMIFIRPDADDPPTRNITFACQGVNNRGKRYLAMVLGRNGPHGMYVSPWPTKGLWDAYTPLKVASITNRNSGELDNVIREAIEIISRPYALQEIKAMGGDDNAVEIASMRSGGGGLSVNAMRRVVRIVLRATKLKDNEEELSKYLSAIIGDNPPPGLTEQANAEVVKWALQAANAN